MTDQQQIEAILRQHNAVLVRTKKHNVYRFPNGRIFVASASPSDSFRHQKNQLRDLRKLLGIHDPDSAQPGTRRERKPKNGSNGKRRYTQESQPINRTLSAQLSVICGKMVL